MGLMINPAPTFTLNNGDIASEGKLFFFENGSTTVKKAIYSNSSLTTELINPLRLTDAGRLPTCFGNGTYTIALESADGVPQWVRNDVTIDDLQGQFADYSTVKTYKVNEIVRYVDGNYYISDENNNRGNTPSENSDFWSKIAFLEFFNTAKAADSGYSLNDAVISGGFLYRSLENNNGDTPPSAKWANLTFNDSVGGNFTVGGDLTVTGSVTASSYAGGESDVGYARYAKKTLLENRGSTTTLAPDSALIVTGLDPTSIYVVRALIRWTGNNSTTNGIKIGVEGTSLAVLNCTFLANSTTLSGPAEMLSTIGSFEKLPNAVFTAESIIIEAVIETFSASNCFIEWAQVSSEVIVTSVDEGSYLSVTKL